MQFFIISFSFGIPCGLNMKELCSFSQTSHTSTSMSFAGHCAAIMEVKLLLIFIGFCAISWDKVIAVKGEGMRSITLFTVHRDFITQIT